MYLIYNITDRLFWFFTGECRSLRENNYQLQRVRRVVDIEDTDYMADGAANDEDEDLESDQVESAEGGGVPVIQTSGLVVETVEGTTVNLPCKVVNGSGKYRKKVMICMHVYINNISVAFI